jgi:putative oxidoreductase
MYGLDFVTQDASTYVGILQMVLVALFVIGLWRTFSYASLALMQAAGVLGSIPNLMNYTSYPNNLMWAAIPALGAAVALFIMRHDDAFSVDGWRNRAQD